MYELTKKFFPHILIIHMYTDTKIKLSNQKKNWNSAEIKLEKHYWKSKAKSINNHSIYHKKNWLMLDSIDGTLDKDEVEEETEELEKYYWIHKIGS